LLPYELSKGGDFKDLAINLGTKQRIFVDDLTGQVWMYDQPYREGSWGHIGGETYTMDNVSRTSYGTDRNILGTDLDPIYQTQLVRLKQYSGGAPAAVYDLILHFPQLGSEEEAEILAYHLASDHELKKDGPRKSQGRIFSVSING